MKNPYFNHETLTSTFSMENFEKVAKITGTEIQWNQGHDPRMIKKMKKRKGKKGGKVAGQKKVASFFDFFDN